MMNPFLWWRERRLRVAKRWVAEFAAAFPGRCPICSFDRHWRENGGFPQPRPHGCPEIPMTDARHEGGDK